VDESNSDHADRLARTLAIAARHRHVVSAEPWFTAPGRYAFDVALCDRDDLPAGLTARVVVTVTEA
jgi:hypothetical protein